MVTKRFTDRQIEALRPAEDRYEKWEGGGFGIRVSPRGVKSWIWVYHFQGRSRRLTLGIYGPMGLADARIRVEQSRKLLKSGIDPGTIEVQQRKAERAAETVGELIEDYLERWARPRKRSAVEDERLLNKDVLPAWGRRKAKDITRSDVLAVLDRVVRRGSPIAANRTLAVIRKMFSWAISQDILVTNPCAMVAPPGKEARRDRVLSPDEIRTFWKVLDSSDLRISMPIRFALKFQLATAQRVGEVIGAEWSEIDLSREKMWSIPSEKAKNGLAHRVPLSAIAVQLLQELKDTMSQKVRKSQKENQDADVSHISRWLFPSPRGDKPISGSAVDHAMRNNCVVLGIPDVTPHDLRRTAASHMTSMGISRLVAAKILNHAESGVTAVYDRHSYDAEKRSALESWGGRLKKIVTSKSGLVNDR